MPAVTKSKADRVREVVVLWKKLTVEFGIPPDLQGMPEIKARLDDFIATGDPWSGKVRLPGIERTAHILLPSATQHTSVIELKVVR